MIFLYFDLGIKMSRFNSRRMNSRSKSGKQKDASGNSKSLACWRVGVERTMLELLSWADPPPLSLPPCSFFYFPPVFPPPFSPPSLEARAWKHKDDSNNLSAFKLQICWDRWMDLQSYLWWTQVHVSALQPSFRSLAFFLSPHF